MEFSPNNKYYHSIFRMNHLLLVLLIVKYRLIHPEGANKPNEGVVTTVKNTFNYRYKHF